MNWMGGTVAAVFWMPVVGPLIAGVVGGVKDGTVRRAVAAVFVPAVLTGALAAAGVTYLADWFPWGCSRGSVWW